MIRVDRTSEHDPYDLGLSAKRAEVVLAMARCGHAFTVRDRASDAVLMIGGALETHVGLATMWAEFANGAGREARAIVRGTRALIRRLSHRRIDTLVAAGNTQGERLVQMLGFVPEARLAGYFEDGADAIVFIHKGDR